MNPARETERRTKILAAAMQAVGTYGYRRTSMEEIARACGMSRPALYQMFSGKADIYRALVEDLTDQALADAREALAADGSLEDRLNEVLLRAVVRPMRMVAALPHGAELLSIKAEVAGDLFRDWDDAMVDAIAESLVERDDFAPDMAQDIGISVMLHVEGLKAREPSIDMLIAGCERIARVAAAAAS